MSQVHESIGYSPEVKGRALCINDINPKKLIFKNVAVKNFYNEVLISGFNILKFCEIINL